MFTITPKQQYKEVNASELMNALVKYFSRELRSKEIKKNDFLFRLNIQKDTRKIVVYNVHQQVLFSVRCIQSSCVIEQNAITYDEAENVLKCIRS